MSEQCGQYMDNHTNDVKIQCRTDSLSMVNKTVPFALPCLIDDNDGSYVVNSDKDNDGSDSNTNELEEFKEDVDNEEVDEDEEGKDGDSNDNCRIRRRLW
jgi:hypothetical protein